MTVNELIEQLQNYPSDMRVLTLGYEGGLNDIYLKKDGVLFNVNDKDIWYIGPHDYAGYGINDDPNDGTDCVIIGRDK
jgi:hypothetical protein